MRLPLIILLLCIPAKGADVRPSDCVIRILASGLIPLRDALTLQPSFDGRGFKLFSDKDAESLGEIPADRRADLVRDVAGAIRETKERLEYLRNRDRSFPSPQDMNSPPKIRLHNLRFLYYQLHYPLLAQTAAALQSKNPLGKDDVVTILNSHFEKYLAGKGITPGYSFDLVLETARSVQDMFSSALENSEYIEIFGSFPNLEAGPKSDVDIFLSPTLMADYQRIYGSMIDSAGRPAASPSYYDFDPRFGLGGVTSRQFALIKAFLKVEDMIASKLNRTDFERTQLLSVHGVSDESELKEFNVMHPVSIRIQKSGVMVLLNLNEPGSTKRVGYAFSFEKR